MGMHFQHAKHLIIELCILSQHSVYQNKASRQRVKAHDVGLHQSFMTLQFKS